MLVCDISAKPGQAKLRPLPCLLWEYYLAESGLSLALLVVIGALKEDSLLQHALKMVTKMKTQKYSLSLFSDTIVQTLAFFMVSAALALFAPYPESAEVDHINFIHDFMHSSINVSIKERHLASVIFIIIYFSRFLKRISQICSAWPFYTFLRS